MADILQQQKVNAAFSKQSAVFDDLENGNLIIQWMRSRIRQHVLSLWKPGEHILELNAGTGLDAIFFAQQGLYVHATDNAEGMISQLQNKVTELKLKDKITIERCSFLELDKLQQSGFDHIFSNFGGLNCTDKLADVITSFDNLLKPGATATLVIMPPVCPWELSLALKGNFKVAFRRLKKDGAPSNVEGISFNSYYYSPSKVERMFGRKYRTLAIEGLCSVVPPPYLEKFPERYSGVFKGLTLLESSIADAWPFRAWADHFIITMQKHA